MPEHFRSTFAAHRKRPSCGEVGDDAAVQAKAAKAFALIKGSLEKSTSDSLNDKRWPLDCSRGLASRRRVWFAGYP
jgi:hypothetical protein